MENQDITNESLFAPIDTLYGHSLTAYDHSPVVTSGIDDSHSHPIFPEIGLHHCDVGQVLMAVTLTTSPVFWVWASIKLNGIRAKQDIEIAEMRLAMVKDLIAEGYERKEAQKLVADTLKDIAARDKNDSALKQILQSVNEAKKILPTSELKKLLEGKSDHDDTPKIEKE